MTAPLDLEAIEAAARAPMSFDRPKINCTHDEERGHAPWCFACDVADRASRPTPFEQRGRGDVLALVAEVRRLRDARDAAAQAFDDLVVRVWRAATGDTHEGPANVDALIEAVERLRAARMEPMTDAALDAACAAEDRATADDLLLDGTDGAHPAWWRGHDRAAEVWSGRVDELTRERDEARADAARAREAYTIDLAGLRDALRRADDDRTRWRERVAELRTDNTRLDDVTRGALDDLARVRAELAAIRAAVRELRDAEAALLTSLDSEIQSGEALPMTDESLRALKARMRPELERIEAARSALDALTREP